LILASITVTSDRSLIIGPALESVSDQVDLMLFVDVGIDLATMKIIQEIAKGRERFIVHTPNCSIGEMRNVGLDFAAACGADWAIQLDTDERMVLPPDLKGILSEIHNVDVFSSLHVAGTYSKERLFRIPPRGHFAGRIHEEWRGCNSSLMQDVLFDELPKSGEVLDKVLISIKDGLEKQMGEDPDNYRWPFQLALCYRSRDEPLTAIAWLQTALCKNALNTTKAWICYCIALCHMDTNDIYGAINWCTTGLGYHPGLAELPHLAGVCCMKLGKPQEALCWANMAISNGLFVGSSFARNRMGHREPYALWEGPFEIQRDAQKAMGYPEELIKESEIMVQQAKKR
jgi:hypothetical protein